jgi:hypothetical protein
VEIGPGEAAGAHVARGHGAGFEQPIQQPVAAVKFGVVGGFRVDAEGFGAGFALGLGIEGFPFALGDVGFWLEGG